MEAVLDPAKVELDELAALEVERARIDARIAAKMLQIEDRRRTESEWTDDLKLRRLELSFVADELGAVLRQPAQAVQVRLAEARRVRGQLPMTWLAHLDGRIDGWRVRLISSAAHNLCEPESLLLLDAKAPTYAATHTATQTRAWLRRFIARVEPGRQTTRARRALSDRQVWIQHEDDGVSWLHALLPTADAVRIEHGLTHRAKLLPTDHRTLDNKRADLLADLLLGRDGSGKVRAGAIIAVTVPVTTLAGVSDAPGESFDGEFTLPAELVRNLASEPGTLFHRVITDPLGKILDITELGRFPSRKLRIAVSARDGTCQVATCSRPAMECDLDHEQPHPRGPTSGANLRPLCRRHHRIKTHLDTDPVMHSMGPKTSRVDHDFASWIVNQEFAA